MKITKVRRILLTSATLILASLCVAIPIVSGGAPAQGEKFIHIFADEDSLTLYVPPDVTSSLKDLNLKYRTDNGSYEKYTFADTGGFAPYVDGTIPPPFCLHLELDEGDPLFPLECQSTGVEKPHIPLPKGSLFWWNRNEGNTRTLMVYIGEKLLGSCEANVPRCYICIEDCATSPPTSTSTITATQTITLTPTITPAITTNPIVYEVKSGDTLSALAARCGVSVEAIQEANGIVDPHGLQIGQELIIPCSGTETEQPPAPPPPALPITPTVVATASPNTLEAKPTLLDPQDQASSWRNRMDLNWEWHRPLGPDEYFQVELRNRKDVFYEFDASVPVIDRAWVRETHYGYDVVDEAYDREYKWRIVVVKGVPPGEKQWSTPEHRVWEPCSELELISEPSEMRTLYVEPPPNPDPVGESGGDSGNCYDEYGQRISCG